MAPRTLTGALGASKSCIAPTLALLAVFFVSFAGRIVALDPTSRITQYGHRVWRVQDGYFGGRVLDITQTTDGYVWAGTEAGLFKFDGVRFVRWGAQSGEELPSSRILSLLGARDGSLWIGTDAGLAHLVNNRLTLYEKNERWWVSYMFQDRDGEIWIDHHRPEDDTHPLCQVLDNGIHCYGSKDGVEADGGGPIAQDSSGNLWMGSPTTLVSWSRGASKVYRPQSLKSNEVEGIAAILPMTDGSLWVGFALAARGAGLQHMVNGDLRPFLAPKLNGATLEVVSLCNDHQNNLWVGTSHGLYRIHGTAVEHFGSEEGLSSDFVLKLFEDHEGNIWAATAQGLDMFRDLCVRTISKREGLDLDAVESVAASHDGSVWIGTSRVQAFSSNEVSFDPRKALPGNQATSLFVDHEGRLWAGMNNRLFVHEGGSFHEITRPDGGALGMVMGITEDLERNIWVETAGVQGALIRIQDLNVLQEFPMHQLPAARKLVADPRGGIWLGLMTGDLARYRNGHLDTFIFGVHPSTPVLGIIAASDGSVLGGTAFGLIGWKDGKQQILTSRNGLPCNTVNGLISDDLGNLWLDMQCGLVKVPSEQIQLWWQRPESRLNVRVFDTSDGVQPGFAHFNSATKTPDGRLWFANGSVVQVIDPAHIPVNTLVPQMDISALIADRKAYPLDSVIRLPPLSRDLEIDYTALSFAAPEKVVFRYMLEGHDVRWREAGTRRQAFYNDLRPGRYHFRVIASNNDGLWNETGAGFTFTIPPAFVQSSSFKALCVLAGISILWSAYWVRLRQVTQRIQDLVYARVAERARIARDLHDNFFQGIQGLFLRFHTATSQLPANEPTRAIFENALRLSDDVMKEGRELLLNLRCTAGDKRDLPSALAEAGRQLQEVHPCEFNVAVNGKACALQPIVCDELSQIAKEALSNAFRHSGASQIEAEVHFEPNQFRLRIRDDGEGIDSGILEQGHRSGHWGLPGMRERARKIGAQIDVWSQSGAGTEVDLTIMSRLAYTSEVNAISTSWFRRLWRSKRPRAERRVLS